MRARRVKGLAPDGRLDENALLILAVRLDELQSFSSRVRDPGNVKALHDMRIAAKRVRYLLELMEPCFGAPARRGAKEARGLQDVLGAIHDCDELVPQVRRHAKQLRARDAEAVLAGADAKAGDLDPAVARLAPNRTAYRGLETLATYLTARRRLLYDRFLADWSRLEKRGFRERLDRDLAAAVE